MIHVSIPQAQADLARYVAEAAGGETVVLCRDGKPVAELRAAAPEAPKTPRPIGLAKGEFVVPPEFFDPLPEDLLRAFYGEPAPEDKTKDGD